MRMNRVMKMKKSKWINRVRCDILLKNEFVSSYYDGERIARSYKGFTKVDPIGAVVLWKTRETTYGKYVSLFMI